MHSLPEPHRKPAFLPVVLGAALLVASALHAPPTLAATKAHASASSASGKKAAKPKAAASKGSSKAAAKTKKSGKTAAKKKDPADLKPGPLADFGSREAAPDVVHVANWVSYTHNNKKKAFVVIDKKNARLYVFDPKGKLKSDAPVLLGKAVGDDSAPGIGNKPLSQIKEEEKTTPAGRFLAIPAKNNHNDDIIWIDYNAAVSMHRMRKVKEEERRAERMATPEVDDNRISNGCVNVPPQFYNSVLRPTVVKYGAYVYVLPETRTPQQQFGAYDVTKASQLAQGAPAGSRS
ncbi:L,D-transpeptidase [Ramlibacter alkalitolerans]|uniref:L,D-transpeptidase n=1 Tax=Ramlibacter alkalitolerans TaxID=2039631 RepID=A0ABS1JQK8_9BURK|nr:L,D-transpeptidase [Ramlibacter alkalitolerans]MBL0426545.1 L,D-transpeptidase [Ramlibacter alkalitolerans]